MKRGSKQEAKQNGVGEGNVPPPPIIPFVNHHIYHRPNLLVCFTRKGFKLRGENLLHNMILSCWDKRLTKFIT